MLHKVLASLLALFTIAFCPAAYAGSYGEVQLAPSYKTTYSASTSYFTGAASATDIFQIYGSGTKTVRVLKIFASNTAGSGDSLNLCYLLKRSTANSGGTASTPTVIPLDSNNAAGTAVVKNYTANPTLGSTVGQVLAAALVGINSASASTTGGTAFPLFDADKYGQAITLRGTGEGLVVNLNGVSPVGTTAKFQFTVVWTEE